MRIRGRSVDDPAPHTSALNPATPLVVTEPPTPLEKVQGVAKNWTTTTTALFGLFSLGGAVIGGNAVTRVPGVWQFFVGLFALAAVVFAGLALIAGARAGYGWPEKPPKTGLGAVLSFAQGKSVEDSPPSPTPPAVKAARRAVDDLEASLTAAGIALGCLVVSVGLLFIATALKVEKPNVTLNTPAESRCLQLVEIRNGQVTVQNRVGKNEVIDLTKPDISVDAGCDDDE